MMITKKVILTGQWWFSNGDF